jgi:hydroxymethylglutaryl-CoA reductase
MTSRLPGFHRLSVTDRRARIGGLGTGNSGDLPLAIADQMIENVVGTYSLPLAIVTNVTINGVDRLIPMAVEEPSIVAAASHAARMVRAGGGFRAEADASRMIGQIQLDDVPDPVSATRRILAARAGLLTLANATCDGVVRRGGGAVDLECRDLGDGLFVVHVLVDTRDAMGANVVNTVAEALGPEIAALAGGTLGLQILSNLADQRLVRVTARVPVDEVGGLAVARRIAAADRFAHADPYRAATHNKGIMNGVDAVLLACGQDWRGVEAGAHAFAARGGQYRSLTRWAVEDEETLTGWLELPMAVGTVGGATRVHPGARRCLQLLEVSCAADLAMAAAVAGLANNLAALRALVTEGIQEGHMRLHGRSSRAPGWGEEAVP